MIPVISSPIRDAPPAAQEPATLVYHAALLSGIGARSVQASQLAAADEQASLGSAEAACRTCIEGGSSLMFSVLAPAARHLRVISRSGPMHNGVLPWKRTYYQPNGELKPGAQKPTWVSSPPPGPAPA